jgi:hypothetical protein
MGMPTSSGPPALLTLLLSSSVGLAACVTTITAPPGGIAATYLGVVRIETTTDPIKSAAAPVVSIDTTAVGARIQRGLGFGFFNAREIYVPMDCRVVFLVRTTDQLYDALRRLGSVKESVCVSVDR